MRLALLSILPSALYHLGSAVPGGPAAAVVDGALVDSAAARLALAAQSIDVTAPKVPVPAMAGSDIDADPRDLLIVTTLDGYIHGVSKSSGQKVWSTKDNWGSLVHVSSRPESAFLSSRGQELELDDGGPEPDSDGGIFIPEPLNDGDLYHYIPGSTDPIERLPFSIKQLVNQSPTFKSGDFVFTSKKVTRLLALDPKAGTILRSFGDGEAEGVANWDGGTDPIMIARTEYMMLISDFKSQKLKWNITFGEFSSASLTSNAQFGSDVGMPQSSMGFERPANPTQFISSSVDGSIVIVDSEKKVPWKIAFDSPAISAFDLSNDESDGSKHVKRIFPPIPTSLGEPRNIDTADIFIGSINNTYYVLSHKNSRMQGIHIDGPITEEIKSGAIEQAGSSDVLSIDSPCTSVHPLYPRCLPLGRQKAAEPRGDSSLSPLPTLPEAEPRSYPRRRSRFEILLGSILGDELVESAEGFVVIVESSWPKISSLVLFSILAVFLHLMSVAWLNQWKSGLADSSADSSVIGNIESKEPLLPQHVPSQIPNSVALSSVKSEVSGSSNVDSTTVSSDPLKPSKKKKKKAKLPKTVSLKNDGVDESDVESTNASSVRVVDESPLKTMTVTETILGYGSHGTIVFKGTFESREVAIKRILVDYYDIAHHEVKILRESDHHPNVLRYHYQEQTEKFLYIALELCPASLYDVIENTSSEYHCKIRHSLDPYNTLKQIMTGISHLHSLKLVHRDIKPQNILVAESKSRTNHHPRILISDFGLCKKLSDDQSSFHNTNAVGGTLGWRAPECMVSGKSCSNSSSDPSHPKDSADDSSTWILLSPSMPNSRITRAIDIFSAGCVFYYVLSGGAHPFGDRFGREMNVLKGNHRLDKLDNLHDGIEAKDLIRRMISKDYKKRPDCAAVLASPFFWSASTKLAFLQDVSDRFEIEVRDPPSALVKQIERGAQKAVGNDWFRKVDRSVIDNLGKYRKYDPTSVQDLLRALRNKKHHYQDLPQDVKKIFGPLPDGFLNYFTSRFPNLLLHVYHIINENKALRSESIFKPYFCHPQ